MVGRVGKKIVRVEGDGIRKRHRKIDMEGEMSARWERTCFEFWSMLRYFLIFERH